MSLCTDYVFGNDSGSSSISMLCGFHIVSPVFVWIHIKLAVSCSLCLLDQTEPPTHSPSSNLDPESLYPSDLTTSLRPERQ
ncbi:hypothetical protein AMECASPLE_009667 [Ameca splendens]|uniref:Uncharacterized protein n=1 Tax=Ameca splendens TaxID=208324 RepID=A0ABV0ZLU4_9TELE